MLLGGHSLELFGELFEIFPCDFGVAIAIGLRSPRGGAGQCSAERRQRGGPLLVGGIDLCADLVLDRSKPRQVDVKLVGPLPQTKRQVAELLRELRARVIGVLATRFEILGDLVEPIRLPLGRFLDLLLLRDHDVLWVREHEHGHEERGCQDDAGCGSS